MAKRFLSSASRRYTLASASRTSSRRRAGRRPIPISVRLLNVLFTQWVGIRLASKVQSKTSSPNRIFAFSLQIKEKQREPTSGLEPLTCSLRVCLRMF
jgi:hypothetical protein